MTTQRRNDQMVSLLSSDFLKLSDPARTLRFDSTEASIGNPPRESNLTVIIDDPANLPNNSFYLVFATDSENMWLVTTNQSDWFYVQMNKAN